MGQTMRGLVPWRGCCAKGRHRELYSQIVSVVRGCAVGPGPFAIASGSSHSNGLSAGNAADQSHKRSLGGISIRSSTTSGGWLLPRNASDQLDPQKVGGY